jgi:hypothetical protein
MGNVVQLKPIAADASAKSIVQCHTEAYLVTLVAIGAAKCQIENDIKVIDAVMRSTDSPHIREFTRKQLNDITTQLVWLTAKLHEAKCQLLAIGTSVGVAQSKSA